MVNDLITLGTRILSTYSNVWDWLFTPLELKILSASMNTVVNGVFDVIYMVGSIVGVETSAPDVVAFELSVRPVDFLVTSLVTFLVMRIVKWIASVAV